jgi:hypothetical protein
MEFNPFTSIVTLTIASVITNIYYSWESLKYAIIALLLYLIFNQYFILLFLIFVFAVQKQSLQLWFSGINIFSDKILRPYSTKLCQILSYISPLESNDDTWPTRHIRSLLKFGSFSATIYFSFQIHP